MRTQPLTVTGASFGALPAQDVAHGEHVLVVHTRGYKKRGRPKAASQGMSQSQGREGMAQGDFSVSLRRALVCRVPPKMV